MKRLDWQVSNCVPLITVNGAVASVGVIAVLVTLKLDKYPFKILLPLYSAPITKPPCVAALLVNVPVPLATPLI